MVIHGHIENGVVIPHGEISLPNGTEVTITVREEDGSVNNVAADEERRIQRESLARLAAMPDENPGDRFSGRDHDRVLYGEP